MEDEVLVTAARHGDKKAFETIVEKYYNDLFRTALSIVNSGWDALDICQETLIKAYLSLHTLRDASKFKPWISRILRNKCQDHFRRNKKTIPIENIEQEGFVEEGNEETLDLLRALSTLSDDIRMVISLRYINDLKIKDIAAVMGCPEGTVKSRLNNGLKTLRKTMNAGGIKEVAE